MHECLANKKHIANIFCCYWIKDQLLSINPQSINQNIGLEGTHIL